MLDLWHSQDQITRKVLELMRGCVRVTVAIALAMLLAATPSLVATDTSLDYLNRSP